MKSIKNEMCNKISCSTFILILNDFRDILGGKWRFPILFLLYAGEAGFNEAKTKLKPITSKALTENLHDLEMNQLIKRDGKSRKFSLTDYSKTLTGIISIMQSKEVDLCSMDLSEDKKAKHMLSSVKDIFKLISGKWRILIIGYLIYGPKRFNDIKVTIDGISSKELTVNLRKLIKLNIIEKNPEEEGARFLYQLTNLGLSFIPLIKEIIEWSNSHRMMIVGSFKNNK